MTTQEQATTKPGRAARIAVGFDIAAFGVVRAGIAATIGAGPLLGFGVLFPTVRAAVALIHGPSYFLTIRR